MRSRVRGGMSEREQLKWFQGLLTHSQGRNLGLPVLHVPHSLRSGGAGLWPSKAERLISTALTFSCPELRPETRPKTVS